MHFQTSLLATGLLAGLALAGTITVVETKGGECAFQATNNVYGCGLNGVKEISDPIGHVKDGKCIPKDFYKDHSKDRNWYVAICNGGTIEIGGTDDGAQRETIQYTKLSYANPNEDLAHCDLSNEWTLGSSCDPYQPPRGYGVQHSPSGFSTAAAIPTAAA